MLAVDDGDGCAPVALAADAPVAQAPSGFFLAQAFFGQQLGYFVYGLLVVQAVERAGVCAHGFLLVAIPLLPGVGGEVFALHGNDLPDGQAVFLRKGKVALVVAGHAHHGAVAIAHQHVVAHPHGHDRAGERVRDRQARVHAFFFFQGQLGLGGAALLALRDEGGQRRVGLRGVGGQRVLRGDGAEAHAHDGVRPGGEDVHAAILNQRAAVVLDVVREGKAQALALADPVFLHQAHALGPAGEGGPGVADLHVVEQLLRVVGDLEVVAGDFALFHQRAGAPAASVNHLLVGQHGLVHRVPVHHLGLAVGDAFFQHLQKQPLVPLVVVGRAGGDLAAPVDRQAHGLHLAFHVGDVVVGPLRGRHLVLERGVFGR